MGEISYTEEAEISFINGLGNHSMQNRATRRELLELYTAAAKTRTNWGEMNRDRILGHCKRLLEG